MEIIHQAFKELYPEKELNKDVSIKYSGKFRAFNANVKYSNTSLQFHLSKEWKTVSKEIKIGLLQNLMVRIFKGKPNTGYRDLYESFIKNLSNYAEVTESDPILEISFNRVNEKYFNGLIEKPNLVWGTESTTQLGSYTYQLNKITISSILKDTPEELLDYIMHHEMLHKKHKYKSKEGRSYHHTTVFKKDEAKFGDTERLEKELKRICTRRKIRRIFF